MSTGVENGFLSLKGGTLYYEAIGSGFPLVLIHSRWMHSGLWDEQVKAFASHYRVIRYDVRGFGKSEMERVPYSDIEDLKLLFDHLNINQAHVLGLSMGAEIAIGYALRYPERVKALVIAGAGLEEFEWSEAFGQEWGLFAGAIQDEDYPRAINQVVKMWVDGPVRPASEAVRERTRELMRGHTFEHHKPFPQPPESETQPVSDSPALTEREKFASLRVPTLVMVGDKDWPEQVKMAELLAIYIPHAEHQVIKDAAHIVNLEQPDIFNQTVLAFLKRH
jgi:pimeloyl-ACP methyl ester carboxylesterase